MSWLWFAGGLVTGIVLVFAVLYLIAPHLSPLDDKNETRRY